MNTSNQTVPPNYKSFVVAVVEQKQSNGRLKLHAFTTRFPSASCVHEVFASSPLNAKRNAIALHKAVCVGGNGGEISEKVL